MMIVVVVMMMIFIGNVVDSYKVTTTIRRSIRVVSNSIDISACSSNRYSSRYHHRATVLESDDDGIYKSASSLREGGLVAFPTETVYGLGANALNETSILNIFKAKRRPLTDPLIVHVASKHDITKLFNFDNNNNKNLARTVCNILCDAFWPGPLTIIHRASNTIPSCVTAGTGNVFHIYTTRNTYIHTNISKAL